MKEAYQQLRWSMTGNISNGYDGKWQDKLAISGKARAGKNTVASFFADNVKFKNSKEKIVALADPMKFLVKTMFPEARKECLYGPSELRAEIISDKYKDRYGKPLTHRQALLDIGAYGRKYNNDIWLHLLVEDANNSKDINTYIVSDVRFLNEFYYLKKSGFIMIRVLRNEHTKINDPSELEQDAIPNSEFNYIIDNNGTLDDLEKEVSEVSLKMNGLM